MSVFFQADRSIWIYYQMRHGSAFVIEILQFVELRIDFCPDLNSVDDFCDAEAFDAGNVAW